MYEYVRTYTPSNISRIKTRVEQACSTRFVSRQKTPCGGGHFTSTIASKDRCICASKPRARFFISTFIQAVKSDGVLLCSHLPALFGKSVDGCGHIQDETHRFFVVGMRV